jgi:ABC-type sulfate/molybdate transport systems ATPase subunit
MSHEALAVRARIRRPLRHFDLDVSLAISPGETLAVVGASGAGKTTVLNCLAGLDRPIEGRIALGDRIVFDSSTGTDLRAEERNLGYVFQDYALFPQLSVFENIAYGLRARRMHRDTAKLRVTSLLDRLHIAHLRDARPANLSGGEQQRVALARALAPEPDLLLLDEPMGALDSTSRKHVRRELRQLLRQVGVTAVLVTHDYEDAVVLGHRVMVMDCGQTTHEGTHEELLRHPRSQFVADLTGVNYFEGVAQAGPDQLRQILVSGQSLYGMTDSVGEVSVSFFPSDVTITTEPPHSSACNVLSGTILEAVNLGGRMRVAVATPLPVVAETTAASFASLGLGEGKPVYLSFKAAAVRVAA